MPAFALFPATFLGQTQGFATANRVRSSAHPYACARPQAPARTIPTSSAASEDRLASVQTQLEFWFSAVNLRRDWYLRRQMDQEGWLDPSVFMHFNRIKQIHATIRDIIDAAERSSQLEVSSPNSSFGDLEAQTRIRRNPDLPDVWQWDDDEAGRSFMLVNIPSDSTIDTVAAVFERLAVPSYVKVFRSEGVAEKALVCFADAETAEHVLSNFAALANHASRELTLRTRKSPDGSLPRYAVIGDTDTPVRTLVRTPSTPLHILHVSELPPHITWKHLREAVSQAVARVSSIQIRYLLYEIGDEKCYVTLSDEDESRFVIDALCDSGIEVEGKLASVRLLESETDIQEYWNLSYALQQRRKSFKTDAKQSPGSRPKGVILKVEGLDQSLSWKKLMREVSKLAPVIYLSLSQEDQSVYIRFKSAADAESVSESLNEQPLFGSKVRAMVLEGEEEQLYWEAASKRQKEKENGKSLRTNGNSPESELDRSKEAHGENHHLKQ
ncbi:RNA binding motif [Gracilaria domingensis]|nr:RNA binding motif [Gracilaria domingensis]